MDMVLSLHDTGISVSSVEGDQDLIIQTLLALYPVCMSVLTCRESDEACLHSTTTCSFQLPTYADFLSLKWDLGVPWITEEVQRKISLMFFLVYGHCLLWSCGCFQWVLEWGWLRDRDPREVASLHERSHWCCDQ